MIMPIISIFYNKFFILLNIKDINRDKYKQEGLDLTLLILMKCSYFCNLTSMNKIRARELSIF